MDGVQDFLCRCREFIAPTTGFYDLTDDLMLTLPRAPRGHIISWARRTHNFVEWMDMNQFYLQRNATYSTYYGYCTVMFNFFIISRSVHGRILGWTAEPQYV